HRGRHAFCRHLAVEVLDVQGRELRQLDAAQLRRDVLRAVPLVGQVSVSRYVRLDCQEPHFDVVADGHPAGVGQLAVLKLAQLRLRLALRRAVDPLPLAPAIAAIAHADGCRPQPIDGTLEDTTLTATASFAHVCYSLSLARTDFAAGNRTPACPARSRD